MPRALFVCPSLSTGGAERQWGLLLPRLRDEFDISLLALNATGPVFEDLAATGIRAYFADVPRRGRARGLRDAWRWAGRDADVVVTWSTNALAFGAAVGAHMGAAHVSHEHSSIAVTGRRLALTRLFAPRVDGVIAVSPSQLQLLRSYGYREERIQVIPNGVDAAALLPARPRADSRAALGVAETTMLALVLANPRAAKRIDVFCQAVAEARLRGADVAGVIAGDGPERRLFAEAAAEHEGITWLGARDDVGDLLAAADVVCLSSDLEALPMSLIEAAAAGRPVVATDVGGVRDIVVPASTGLVVPPGDPGAFANTLARLAADPATRDRFGREARARFAGCFDIDRIAERFSAALRAAATR